MIGKSGFSTALAETRQSVGGLVNLTRLDAAFSDPQSAAVWLTALLIAPCDPVLDTEAVRVALATRLDFCDPKPCHCGEG